MDSFPSNVSVMEVKDAPTPTEPDAPPVPPGIRIEVPMSVLQQRKLFIAVPMYGGMCYGTFAQSLYDLGRLCAQAGIEVRLFHLVNESLITRARNYCVDEFMRSGFTHLMFIDSDIGFNPHDVIGLLALQSDDSPYDVIGGPYAKKCISWEKVKMAVDKGFADEDPNRLALFIGDYVFNPKAGTAQIPLNQPAEMLEIGTGFMMIRRQSFETFQKKFPHYWYKPDHVRTKEFDGSREIMMYFQAEIDQLDFGHYYGEKLTQLRESGISDPEALKKEIDKIISEAMDINSKKSKRYLSEDYWFCQKLQEAGLTTWLCPWMRLTHTGTMVFGGSLLDLAQISAPATADPNLLKGKKQ